MGMVFGTCKAVGLPMSLLQRLQYLRRPILRQIDRYRAWRGAIYPLAATRDSQLLRQLIYAHRIRNCEGFTDEVCKEMVFKQNSLYFKLETARTLRKFIRYLVWAGYMDVAPIVPKATMSAMTERIDTRIHWDQVKRVQQLRDGEGLSFRKIQARMEHEDNRPYNIKMVHSWYKRVIPAGV
jgi:hypothetical protein